LSQIKATFSLGAFSVGLRFPELDMDDFDETIYGFVGVPVRAYGMR
jgi:hypothetical protein